MPRYYVNKKPQVNGDHEVHKEGCMRLPVSVLYVGDFLNCNDALEEAKKLYPEVNACYWCSTKCHTR